VEVSSLASPCGVRVAHEEEVHGVEGHGDGAEEAS
jgi:hypothetical protein